MRITLATRIFMPEASAASFRLEALANTLHEAGHEVTVLTATPPPGQEATHPYTVKRFPVLRDKAGYVRGYLQYMSFDIPLVFRLLFSKKPQAVIAEPPPTTAFVVRVICGFRRIPFFCYAADVWSDASESAGAAKPVVAAVRWMERVAWNRSRGVFSVNDGVSDRVREIAPQAVIRTVGNGVDTQIFSPVGESRGNGRFLIYTGTASEWQGAEILIDAMPIVAATYPDARLVFLGGGSAWPELEARASHTHGACVEFIPTVPPAEAAAWIRGAVSSVASLKPGMGYDFAFPTKVFASWATGTPVVYVGPGPASRVLAEQPELGEAVPYDRDAVAGAFIRSLAAAESASEAPELSEPSARISAWAEQNVSLRGVAGKALAFIHERLSQNTPR